MTKLSCSSFYLCEYDSAVLSESGCENGTVKSSLPFCGYTKWDQTCSRRWQNSKCCADGGGEDMLSAKSSLLFFKMSITSQMLWLAATSGCLLHFWIFTHLVAVIWLCQQGSGTCRWTNPNRNKFWEDERNQFCEDKCAACVNILQPMEIARTCFRISLSYNQWFQKEVQPFPPLVFSCHTAVNLPS